MVRIHHLPPPQFPLKTASFPFIARHNCKPRAMKNWNPDKYLEHAELHSQPIENLVSHIKNKSPRTIVDLGCGPGNSTEFAAARWPRAKMTGVDVSKEMLEKARTRHPDWT